jgi:predicted ATP-dependent serine protease
LRERDGGLRTCAPLGSYSVYASVAGALRVSEPAADLGIAIASAFRGLALAADSVAFAS